MTVSTEEGYTLLSISKVNEDTGAPILKVEMKLGSREAETLGERLFHSGRQVAQQEEEDEDHSH